MLAIDTNIVVRYLTADEPVQATNARRLIDAQNVFVSSTVMLESEWVLRSVYGYERSMLANALGAFAGLERVTLDDPPAISKALAWMRGGMDFSDALHLAKAEGCEAFVSFDARFAKLAASLNAPKVRVL